MANYKFKAVDSSGKGTRGTIDAPSEEKAKEKLKSSGLTVQEIKNADAGNSMFKKKVKDKDLAIFCKQFNSVLNAGVTVISALDMMAEQIDNVSLKEALRDAQNHVQKGGSLAEGFKLNPKVFPQILVNMVAAGELSGNLETSFERLTTHFENSNKLKSKVKGAMTYPIVILVVVIAVVIVLLVKVIPQFSEMFTDMGTELPAATQLLVNVSGFLQHKGWLVAVIVIFIVAALKAYGKTEQGELIYSKISMKLPLFGNLVIKSAAATFSRTLATLLASGIPLMDAIEQVAKMIKNKIIRDDLLEAKVQVAKGVPLSKPLRDMEYFPPMLSQMTRIGEETGNIEDMMDKVADYYEMEVNNVTDALTAMMEPMIIVVMAVVVGGIVLAIYAPMLSMYDAVDNY